MKALVIALIIIIWNISMAVVINADVYSTGNTYYENTILNSVNDTGYINISSVNEDEQLQRAGAVANNAFSVTGWGWINAFVPLELRSELQVFVSALDLLSIFFISLAVIELWTRRSII